ncbi:diacylglycerol kinase family protein [Brevundimonas sp.]|uniref:diacylglycerol/lipid kinase family protein n=1 Tax=Brevundimonas sp. TaxID=1871086 RepID=UPI001D4AA022|nr:diacylglycerol kinase family protein [Brevundimonas sp.]MBA4000576.1 diacylglycerol kinase [Brevundimonas sp.]
MTDTLGAPPEEQLPEDKGSVAERRPMTCHAPIKHVVVLVNPMSGSVGANAAAEARDLMAGFACESEVVLLEGADMARTIDKVLSGDADLVVVLAGDGTARAVASRAGPDGPLVAPLPGGTMNMLPKALYGTTDWKKALSVILEDGEPQYVSGGEVDGHAFYCAAILGAPALWAPAREALRGGKLKLALTHARRAWRRAFSGRIRFDLDGGPRQRAEALVLISPMISRALEEPVGLEAAAMNPHDASDAFRLAAHALFDDWRHDPAVRTRPARRIRVSARSRVPAVLDGEPILLPADSTVRFLPRAFRALAPRPPAAEDTV